MTLNQVLSSACRKAALHAASEPIDMNEKSDAIAHLVLMSIERWGKPSQRLLLGPWWPGLLRSCLGRLRAFKERELQGHLRIYGFEGEAGREGEGRTRIRESSRRRPYELWNFAE